MLAVRRHGLKTLEGVLAHWRERLSWQYEEDRYDREDWWREYTVVLKVTVMWLAYALGLQSENAHMREEIAVLKARDWVSMVTEDDLRTICTGLYARGWERTELGRQIRAELDRREVRDA